MISASTPKSRATLDFRNEWASKILLETQNYPTFVPAGILDIIGFYNSL